MPVVRSSFPRSAWERNVPGRSASPDAMVRIAGIDPRFNPRRASAESVPTQIRSHAERGNESQVGTRATAVAHADSARRQCLGGELLGFGRPKRRKNSAAANPLAGRDFRQVLRPTTALHSRQSRQQTAVPSPMQPSRRQQVTRRQPATAAFLTRQSILSKTQKPANHAGRRAAEARKRRQVQSTGTAWSVLRIYCRVIQYR